MDLKDYLTNEKLRKKFDSQFELVNYAIKLAGNMIQTGRDARVKIDSQNRAMQILTEILQGKDQFDEVITPKQEPTPAYHFSSKDKDLSSKDNDDDDEEDEIVEKKSKAKERKKTRKILAD